MIKTYTCRECGEPIEADPEKYGITWVMRSKNYYYHAECFNKFKDKGEEKDDYHWFDLIFFIFNNELHSSYNFFQIKAQATKMVREKGFTMKGIYFTLYYHYIIKKQPYDPKYGIGIVPYVYDEATNYWYLMQKKQLDILEQIQKQEEAKVIMVRPQKRKKRQPTPPPEL